MIGQSARLAPSMSPCRLRILKSDGRGRGSQPAQCTVPPPTICGTIENGVGTAVIDGGQEQIVNLDLEKGKYALVCFITDRNGGPPHAAMGMIDELDVK